MKRCYHCMQEIEDTASVCPHCGNKLDGERKSEKHLKPGSILQSKFLVGASLGAGGFGITYIGWDEKLYRKVAIKEFFPEQYAVRGMDGVSVRAAGESYEDRFANGLGQFIEEARSIAALTNIRGVVDVISFFEENGTGYMVMEYLEGMDVRHILKRSGGRREYDWCRRVILTLLYTLRQVHAHGVLHRDISPDNVFVRSDGVIKLIDFGAAKQQTAAEVTTEEIKLKAGYAPIEQYSRTAQQGPYTDMYAVAAMFYRMLTGKKPPAANERFNTEMDPLVPPSRLGVALPEAAEVAIMYALNVRQENRFQSAEEFMAALGGTDFVPVDEPEWIFQDVEEEKTDQGPRVVQWFRKLPVAAKAGMVAASIAVVGAAAFGLSTLGNPEKVVVANDSVPEGSGRLQDCFRMPYEEAVELLKQEGFTNIAEPVYDYSSDEEGVVVRQEPDTGVVPLDTEIRLQVSGGNQRFTMPDFSQEGRSKAVQYFTEKNFSVEIAEDPYGKHKKTRKGENSQWRAQEGKVVVQMDFDESVEKDGFVSQSVAAGSLYDSGKVCTLVYSLGKKSDYIVKMPNLSGKTEQQVKEELKKKGLDGVLKVTFQKNSAYSDTVPAGAALSQSIEAGKKLNILKDEGKSLTVPLSRGKKPAPVVQQQPRQQQGQTQQGQTQRQQTQRQQTQQTPRQQTPRQQTPRQQTPRQQTQQPRTRTDFGGGGGTDF